MSSVPVCPVPKEQQPLEEYQALKDAWFFRWAALERFQYHRPFIVFWGIGWLISAPIASVSFPMAKDPVHFGLSSAAGATIIPLLVLLRIYLGWFYIRNRLLDETVVYEESGWYDGQVWDKPPEVVERDRLIVSYQIQPILNRLKTTFLIIGLSFLAGFIVWWTLTVVQSLNSSIQLMS
ncbi:MAG: CGLD27 family protein [Leptolyngbyaceae bacterium]|nr:CGLD27 family protein [Leptolyngbyaceae bacterium]